MNHKKITVLFVAVALCLFIAQGAVAEEMTAGDDEIVGQDLSYVEDNRAAIISGIIENWRSELDAQEGTEGWDDELAAALESAPADKVLAASKASTYAEVAAALFGRWTGPSVLPLEPGESPEDIAALGDNFRDLVFTPLTPCRIIDTRGTAAGRINANTGRQFQVNLSNFISQGGNAGPCGIPTNLEVSAVAINVTPTGALGGGNVSVIETGGGIPNTSLVNFRPGVNIANAAVVRSGLIVGNDIFIFSRFAATHVVVDLLGYFAAPLRTRPDNWAGFSQVNVANNTSFSVFAPPCPSGFRLSGGGCIGNRFTNNGYNFSGDRPVAGTSTALASGTNTVDRWLCQGRNEIGSAEPIRAYSLCVRVPGR